MSYNIDSTFPAKLGDVTSMNGMPMDTTASTYNSRLTRLFKRVFGGMSNKDDKYWELLKDMISNPNDVFGLVGIDGYYTDIMGKDDIALVFNMGIPKLRGRKVNYLDRIYCRIAAGSNIKFYNSFLDSDIDDVHFEFEAKIVAWHPHISGGEPCLGSYSNDLARWKSEGNPIMYLKTVHQFVNTWNVRSPFWNMNEVAIDHVNGKKAFKSSKFMNAFSKVGQSHTRAAERWVFENVNEINTGSIANDIYCLVNIYAKEQMIKQSVIDTFVQFLDDDILSYLSQHHHDHTSDSPNRNDTIITGRTRVIIPTKKTLHGVDTTVFTHSTLGHGKLGNDNGYESKRIILDALSRIIYDLYKWIRTTQPIDEIFKDDGYIMSMKCKYLFPLTSRNNVYFDQMTLSGLYDHRVCSYSTESSTINPEHYAKKRTLVRRLEQRRLRLDRLYMAHFRKKLTRKTVTNIVDEKLRSFFSYEINKNEPFTKKGSDGGIVIYHHMVDQGRFWNNLGIYSTQGMFKEVEEFVKESRCWISVEKLIDSFETLKRELVMEETNSLINQYDKVIRRLKDYGHKTHHSEEDTQQIHLSFE